MSEQSETKKDIIREFCRSQGAPTAYWLGRLSAEGKRECIRQWIVKSRNVEIESQMDAVAEKLFEERTGEDPFFYDALSAEDLEDRVEHARRRSRQRLNEQVRYGAICIDEIDSPQPWVEYDQYHQLCDQEWQLIVQGRRVTKAPLYSLLATLLTTAIALAFSELYAAAWCIVIGGLATTFLAWPRDEAKQRTGEQVDRVLRGMLKKSLKEAQ